MFSGNSTSRRLDPEITLVRTAGGPSFWRARRLPKTLAVPPIRSRAIAKRIADFLFMLSWLAKPVVHCLDFDRGGYVRGAGVRQTPANMGAGYKFPAGPPHALHFPIPAPQSPLR